MAKKVFAYNEELIFVLMMHFERPNVDLKREIMQLLAFVSNFAYFDGGKEIRTAPILVRAYAAAAKAKARRSHYRLAVVVQTIEEYRDNIPLVTSCVELICGLLMNMDAIDKGLYEQDLVHLGIKELLMVHCIMNF